MRADLTKERLENLYKNYGSIREMAKAVGTNPKSLAREMRKLNLSYDRSARKYDIHHDFFARNEEQTFYWAGFVAAGANVVHNHGYRIEFNISVQDREHLEFMVSSMGGNTPVKNYTSRKGEHINNYVRLVLSSKYLVADLYERWGISPRKKFVYSMPNWLLVDDNLRHFIRGWTDGLGGFSYNPAHNQVKFTTRGTHLMIKQIKTALVNDLGVGDDVIIVRPVDETLEVLTITNREVLQRLFDYLYLDSTVCLQRKKNEALLLNLK